MLNNNVYWFPDYHVFGNPFLKTMWLDNFSQKAIFNKNVNFSVDSISGVRIFLALLNKLFARFRLCQTRQNLSKFVYCPLFGGFRGQLSIFKSACMGLFWAVQLQQFN